MKRVVYSIFLTVALAVVAAAQTSPQTSPAPSSSADVMTTAGDEVTVENNIESYLNRKGLKTASSLVNDKTRVISMRFEGKNGQPNYEFRITSSPANPSRIVFVWLMTVSRSLTLRSAYSRRSLRPVPRLGSRGS